MTAAANSDSFGVTLVLIATLINISPNLAGDSTVAVAVTSANASHSWQRLLFNQAKYDDRLGDSKQRMPQLHAKPGGSGGGAESDFSFEEQDYRLEDVLLRPGQMIEILGLSNYLPRYMRFERPPPAGLQHTGDDDFDNEDDDLDEVGDSREHRRKPSLEQLLMVTPADSKQAGGSTRDHLRRRRHRSSGSGTNSRRHHRRRRRQQLDDDRVDQLSFLRRPQRRRLRRYLLAATACRVSPGWRDLGKAFWPRWLRLGECRQPPGGSCSIPAGMRCQPATWKRLYVLRYLCAKHWLRSQCRWVRQSLQVLQSCECRCG